MNLRRDWLIFYRYYIESQLFEGYHDQDMLNLFELELRELNREIEAIT